MKIRDIRRDRCDEIRPPGADQRSRKLGHIIIIIGTSISKQYVDYSYLYNFVLRAVHYALLTVVVNN